MDPRKLSRSTEAIAVPQFRIACEECHDRKIRCEPSSVENSGGGSCEACRLNGRRCLFSLKSKTGRPKNSKSSSTAPSVLSTSGSSSTETPASSVSTTSSRSASRSNTTVGRKASNSTSIIESRNRPPLRSERSFPAARREQLNAVSWQTSPGPHQLQFSQSPVMPAYMTGSLPVLAQGESRDESEFSNNRFVMGDDLHHPLEWPFTSVHSQNRESTNPDPFINYFQEMPYQGESKHASQNKRDLSVEESKWPQTDLPNTPGGRKASNTTDFVRALELYRELQRYSESRPSRPLSLLADRDSPEVRIMLDSLDKLCSKIAAVIPSSREQHSLMDQRTSILVFSAVMQATDQTIDRLNNLLELESRFDPGQNILETTMSTDYDVSMDQSDYGPDMNSAQDHLSPIGHFQHDFLVGSMLNPATFADLSELEVDHLLSLTRLDFYLLRFKSFVSVFEPSTEVLEATKFNFQPAESAARLLSFHRCIQRILESWKTGWYK